MANLGQVLMMNVEQGMSNVEILDEHFCLHHSLLDIQDSVHREAFLIAPERPRPILFPRRMPQLGLGGFSA
jgi:hypothetical protein